MKNNFITSIRVPWHFYLCLLLILVLSMITLSSGDIDISLSEILLVFTGKGSSFYNQVIFELRLPRLLTAIFSGASLALCGLLLQTYFQNPLAGPFVLGIHSGSAFFVSLWILAGQSLGINFAINYSGMNTIIASWIGSLTVMAILFTISVKIPGKVILLVIGLLLGYFSGALINILVALGDPHEIKTFLTWSMGSFHRTSISELKIMVFILFISTLASLFIARGLNLIFVGEVFSKSLGINPKKIKIIVLIITSLLAAVVTSFCGPVAFVGMISPHFCRLILKTENHFQLIPYTVAMGALIAIFADLLSSFILPFGMPLNSVLGLLGAPFIILFLMKNKIGSYA
ncbi:MAG: iron ABC transporter permease [Bacteriovoracaceae bacterium]|jgi:iron complex transport system permease protein|nr:iron ABC transporter permease [Bacteriovoracaceae bacterium]